MDPSPFALPDHRIVAFNGRDAAAYAQAQFMSDAKGLAAGNWQWSGWLTPKGRVIALFSLLKFDDENVWLLLQDADPAEFVARLQRFVFRSKVSIAVREDLRATGVFQPAPAGGSRLAIAGNEDVALDLGGAGGNRTLRLSAADAGTDEDALARWIAFDLAHGWPHLSATQSEQWTPQQLSLDRLRAYSVKKGCYPGQEIVARTHFLGQAKRGLVRLEAEQPLAPGDVLAGSGAIGKLICVAGREGLAVMPAEASSSGLSVNGVPCRPLPLLGGLER